MVKSYGHFTDRVDFAYWWSFSGGGSAVNEATPSSLIASKSIMKDAIFKQII